MEKEIREQIAKEIEQYRDKGHQGVLSTIKDYEVENPEELMTWSLQINTILSDLAEWVRNPNNDN
jgi:hypothetical protein